MMRRAVLVAAALSLTASPAMAAPPCLTAPEAESLAAVAMPEILRETGRVCAATLPATALVRRDSGPLIAKYQREADRAWPAARTALLKLSDPMVAPLVDSEYARPLLTTLVVKLIVGRVDTGDCGMIDRMATLLEPLPARNTAGIVVTALQYLKVEKAKKNAAVQNVPDLPLCPSK